MRLSRRGHDAWCTRTTAMEEILDSGFRRNDAGCDDPHSMSFRPSVARAGIQRALAAAICISCKGGLESAPAYYPPG